MDLIKITFLFGISCTIINKLFYTELQYFYKGIIKNSIKLVSISRDYLDINKEY